MALVYLRYISKISSCAMWYSVMKSNIKMLTSGYKYLAFLCKLSSQQERLRIVLFAHTFCTYSSTSPHENSNTLSTFLIVSLRVTENCCNISTQIRPCSYPSLRMQNKNPIFSPNIISTNIGVWKINASLPESIASVQHLTGKFVLLQIFCILEPKKGARLRISKFQFDD